MSWEMFRPLIGGGVVAVGVMTVLWIVQWRRRDAGVVDIGWTGCVGFLAAWIAWHTEGEVVRRIVIAFVAGVWSLRLVVHLLVDRIVGKPEDGRYQYLRAHWGARAQPYFFLFFQAQAIAALLFAVPLLVAASDSRPFGLATDYFAVGVWLIAIGGEALADRQLATFRRDPKNKGRTCREGLWGYSRHPNYFFEWLHWWSYVLFGIGAAGGWLTLLGPIVMLVLLFRVTGIPYTEKQALKSRGDDYCDYQRTVSPFIPWFRRHHGTATTRGAG